MDVSDLERSVGFYRDLLGFQQVGAGREGLPFESRTLQHADNQSTVLCLRRSYRRPVIGSQIGGFLALGLRVPDLRAAAERVKGKATLLTSIPETGPIAHFQFLDPDGYVIELFE